MATNLKVRVCNCGHVTKVGEGEIKDVQETPTRMKYELVMFDCICGSTLTERRSKKNPNQLYKE